MTFPRWTLLLTCALLITTGAAASTAIPQNETFRCELTQFVEDLRAVPSLGVEAEAASRIAALSPAELSAIEAALSPINKWQQLPVVMASLEAAGQSHDRLLVGRLVASGVLAGGITSGDRIGSDEDFRVDMLFLIDQLGRFSPVMDESFGESVRRLRITVAKMPTEALISLRRHYEEQAATWERIMISPPILAAQTINALRQQVHACNTDCGDLEIGCWIALAGCAIGEIASLVTQVANYVASIAQFVIDFFDTTLPNLFNQIGQLATKAVQWFTDVFNQVSTFVTAKFNEIKNALPDTPAEILAFVLNKTGVNFNQLASAINWDTISRSIPTISPPCPSGSALTTIGAVCDSGANAITELLYEVAPDDGLSLAFKLGLAFIHFPLSYLCQCVDIADAHAAADAEASHRSHVTTNLNVKLSTRATASSVAALAVSLANVDADVAKAEGKLDQLEATAARIETNVNRIDATTGRLEATTNRTETKTNHAEATTNRTEAKVDALTTGNSTQQSFLGDFSTLMTRLNIEENLLHNKPDVISLFQLPLSFGGKLETVAAIVTDTIRMNLAAGQSVSGAEREVTRGNGLRLAGDFIKAYEAYRSAYSEVVK